MGMAFLDYHDILLRDEDVNLLRGPEWLNDQVISFYFEYLAREKYTDTNFGFVGGCLASFLINAGFEDALSCTEPLKLKDKELILLPVNNSTDPTTANSGSHWSLLVISTADRRFLHFDSAEGVNKLPARLLAEKMQRLLECALGFYSRKAGQEWENRRSGVCKPRQLLRLRHVLHRRSRHHLPRDQSGYLLVGGLQMPEEGAHPWARSPAEEGPPGADRVKSQRALSFANYFCLLSFL